MLNVNSLLSWTSGLEEKMYKVSVLKLGQCVTVADFAFKFYKKIGWGIWTWFCSGDRSLNKPIYKSSIT